MSSIPEPVIAPVLVPLVRIDNLPSVYFDLETTGLGEYTCGQGWTNNGHELLANLFTELDTVQAELTLSLNFFCTKVNLRRTTVMWNARLSKHHKKANN